VINDQEQNDEPLPGDVDVNELVTLLLPLLIPRLVAPIADAVTTELRQAEQRGRRFTEWPGRN
jgi:hypothetical protein